GTSDWSYEFQLISIERTWNFEAPSAGERDEWVQRIEEATLSRLQSNEVNKRSRQSDSAVLGVQAIRPMHEDCVSNRDSSQSNLEDNKQYVASIKAVMGNQTCADCNSANPEWASLNLGILVCIGCSGVHRQLGTHISRVRSLTLDKWSPELVSVMRAIGNTLANAVWEAATPINAGAR
ncbi:Arf-GAP with GTPase, ANK repeat and PH domain-containing protein 2, partial [Cichlidogyrus casuarinus]